MTQASSTAKNPPATTPSPSLGAAAAAAATTTPAKPADAAAGAAAGASADKKKERNGSKVFVVTGTLNEFETINQAEKFLNAEGAPAEYVVLRGKRIGTSKKVSLR